MPYTRAIVFIDSEKAHVIRLDSLAHDVARHFKLHGHDTPQHNSAVRGIHEFFGEVCDSLGDLAEVVVAGSHTNISALKHYVEKHRPHLSNKILGFEAVDRLTDNQLVAHARQFFDKHVRLAH